MRARTGAVAVLLALAACTNHRAAAVPPTVSASPSP
ncbi:MAG: hypothetical protein QOG49_1369, partial [Frankiaceae bacterium]|nr:hypothetical protein [Frankiaceae bacterium]